MGLFRNLLRVRFLSNFPWKSDREKTPSDGDLAAILSLLQSEARQTPVHSRNPSSFIPTEEIKIPFATKKQAAAVE